MNLRSLIPLAPLLALALALSACAGPATPSASPPDGGLTCTYEQAGTAARPVELPPATGVANTGTAAWTLKMGSSDVALTLDRSAAPCTVNSFESLARQGFFDNTACHRVTDSGGLFVLQCGDPTGTGSGGPGYQFADELEATSGYPAGTLAMANAGPDTNGSQFFIVWADSQLPPAYTVFGSTDEAGVEVVAAIAAGGHDGRYGSSGGGVPLLPAEITSVAAD